MDINKIKQLKRTRRRTKIRKKISGMAQCPRLSVFRSNTGLFLQIIDDSIGKTIVSADSKEIKVKGAKIEVSLALGKLIAEKALAKNIKQIVFDRGGYRFHGRVKAVAQGAREAGLEF
jgi:large subunit ribosomal protein L18